MNRSDFISALSNVSDEYILESASTEKPIHRINRKTALFIAAALMAFMLVACGVYSMYAASSEVMTDEFPDITVSERMDHIQDLTVDKDVERYKDVIAEYGIAEKDIVSRYRSEYLRDGYYFDELILTTKDKAIGRIITDAVNFTFDVEFVGFFYNEKNDEFKTVTQTTAAQGGKIEIVMNAEKGWECIGGILGRNHPESEVNTFTALYSQKYGHPASVRAMQFFDKYYDENIATNESQRSRGAEVISYHYNKNVISHEVFSSIETDDPDERMASIASACGIESVPTGEVYYDKQVLSDGEFVEAGYVYDESGLVAFLNNTIKTDEEYERFYIAGIFYNQRSDRYMVVWRNTSFSSGPLVFSFQSKYGWKCIGVTMLRTTPETEDTFFTTSEAITPVLGDESDSYEFFEKVNEERDYTMRFLIGTDIATE